MKRLAFLLGALALAGCQTLGAASGDASDCAGANRELAKARAALALAQRALTVAESLGNPPAVRLAQVAVDTIGRDVDAIQALVGRTCSPSLAGASTITLDDARARAEADKRLADSLQSAPAE